MPRLVTRVLTYHVLVLLDLWRLWRAAVLHVVILAGICLPILMLSGLKRGHVETLARKLRTSPTATQILCWSAQQGELLSKLEIKEMAERIPDVKLVIPDIVRPVAMSVGDSPPADLTLYSTLPEDPILEKYNADVLNNGEDAIVLAKSYADRQGIALNDPAKLLIRRQRSGRTEQAEVPIRIKAIVDLGDDRNIGYMNVSTLDRVDQYIRGFAVPEWRLGAFAGVAPADTYGSYLIFCQRSDDLRPVDLETLQQRGYVVRRLEEQEFRALFTGLLKEDTVGQLIVYELSTRSSKTDAESRLRLAPSEISDLTLAEDDVAMAWNEPLRLPLNGADCQVVGCSLPELIWLRFKFVEPSLPFQYDDHEFTVRYPAPHGAEKWTLDCEGASIALAAAPLPQPPRPPKEDWSEASAPLEPPDSIIVPAQLLAHLTAMRDQRVGFDSANSNFVALPQPPEYDKARLYATDIYAVPTVASTLVKEQFAVMSKSTQIREIQEQDASLGVLVRIVMYAVVAFGVVTVAVVLLDATDRKRRTIGILRIMGVSGLTISYMVVTRALLIGLLAGCLTWYFGQFACAQLAWTSEMSAELVGPAQKTLGAAGLACLAAAVIARRRPWAAVGWGLFGAAGLGAAILGTMHPGEMESAIRFVAQFKPTAGAELRFSEDVFILLAAMGCSFIGSLVPAMRASFLDPFDAVVDSKDS